LNWELNGEYFNIQNLKKKGSCIIRKLKIVRKKNAEFYTVLDGKVMGF
jgi:hypothetical protein